MTNVIHYTTCPVCGSASIKDVLIAEDHTVSGKTFTVMQCDNCTARFTQDVPDANSIGAYYKSDNYISHSNTSKGLVNSLYQKVRKKTLRQKRELIERVTGVRKGDLLDVGSGTGSFLHEMKENKWNVTGLEPDADARKLALSTYQVELNELSGFFQLTPNSFDAITLWHVLEHVHDLQGYVQQLKSLLKENGKLFIAVPNYTSKDAVIYKENWAAYDVPRHLYHFSPKSMQLLIERNGMKIEKYLPMWYDSFYVSMLSSKYKNGKTNLFSAFWNGCRSNLAATMNTKECSSVIYIVSK